MEDPETRLEAFIDRFTPQVAADARLALVKTRALLPGAVELVYDNYNALAVAFGASDMMADVVCSIALYPRWVSLFFPRGAGHADPHRLLKGAGARFRHIVLRPPALLDDPHVHALFDQSLAGIGRPLDPTVPGRIIIKSVSARQRPRRP